MNISHEKIFKNIQIIIIIIIIIIINSNNYRADCYLLDKHHQRHRHYIYFISLCCYLYFYLFIYLFLRTTSIRIQIKEIVLSSFFVLFYSLQILPTLSFIKKLLLVLLIFKIIINNN